ncbi:ADP-ribosylation factor [Lingula anatina]|uniref:ADP-ribosylation factor n=1 Tax=Lingula anatina TaxID=7574 RepID=A0A1S3IW15_LINAN|nr:ADP-ribosylation factor [Lingula anatina]|eukprot:XP_013401744.1 ADP-ribosylation factor [Lingula anatina]
MKLILVGLDGAGKTAILYTLKWNFPLTTGLTSTLGYNVEEVSFNGIAFEMWDLGGEHQTRAIWRQYFKDTQGIIFVVDSSCRERFSEAKEEIERLMKYEALQALPLCTMAHKQDLPGALSPEEVTQLLSLTDIRDRKWTAIPSSVTASGSTGLQEALQWFSALS